MDRAIDAWLKKLARQKGFDKMPFYAVTYEQALPGSMVRRAAMVSQSPQLIQQWIDEITSPPAPSRPGKPSPPHPPPPFSPSRNGCAATELTSLPYYPCPRGTGPRA